MFSMYISFSYFTHFQSHFTLIAQRISSTSLAHSSYGIDVWVDISSHRIHTQTHTASVPIVTSSVFCQKTWWQQPLLPWSAHSVSALPFTFFLPVNFVSAFQLQSVPAVSLYSTSASFKRLFVSRQVKKKKQVVTWFLWRKKKKT